MSISSKIRKGAEMVDKTVDTATKTARTIKAGAEKTAFAAKTTAHVFKTGAEKTNEFLHSEGVQNARNRAGTTIQNMVKAGAQKASSLFSKMKEFYRNHVNVELNNVDREALQNYRDSLQDTIDRTQNSPLKNAMQETVYRLDKDTIVKVTALCGLTVQIGYCVFNQSQGQLILNLFRIK